MDKIDRMKPSRDFLLSVPQCLGRQHVGPALPAIRSGTARQGGQSPPYVTVFNGPIVTSWYVAARVIWESRVECWRDNYTMSTEMLRRSLRLS